jgi:7,8-dihydropterin-6-yl-methyl-4-(beta-D-ribofuranosyl)aminobenzene 5'-phosphate synthase
MAKLRISVLTENTVRTKGLLAEHGLALWIEIGDRKILFDAGQGMALYNNACFLGINLEEADMVILSHGHYDHTGGLPEVLEQVKNVSVYAHPAVFEIRFSRHSDGGIHNIAMPRLSQEALRQKANLILSDKPKEIFPGFHLTGAIPRVTDFEDTGGDFYLDRECLTPDPVLDDQAVFIETSSGLVVILGCAHSGVINTLNYIRKLTGNASIHTVIGGMHLGNASESRIAQTIQQLKKLKLQALMPAHCTGFAASVRLSREFAGIFRHVHVASTIETEI